MEFLTTAFEAVRELIAGNWITAAVIVAPFVLPNQLVYKAGYGAGRAASLLLRQKAGKRTGERVEGYLQGSLSALTGGVNDGMDLDDHENGKDAQ